MFSGSRFKIVIIAASVAALAACSQSPQDAQADAVLKGARARAGQIRQQAGAQARALDERSKSLGDQAKQTGGYTGQGLKVQADAFAHQADILREQGEAQAGAVVEAADAQAKAIHSR
ncbi:MAG: hypothetical protein ABI056_00185 [Caulobacteraceae bacterium]